MSNHRGNVTWVEGSGERRGRTERCLGPIVEEVVRPPEGSIDRTMALDGAAAAVQHADALVDAGEHLLCRQRLQSRRGEFQRERQTIESAGELVEVRELVPVGRAPGQWLPSG